MKIYWTKSIGLYNFLWEQGIKPIVEQDDYAAYYRTANLVSAIESYEIRNYYFKNRK